MVACELIEDWANVHKKQNVDHSAILIGRRFVDRAWGHSRAGATGRETAKGTKP
jgi:hypothetical protein